MGAWWKHLAWLGRYARQDVWRMMERTREDLNRLAEATAEIVREENARGGGRED